MSFMLHFGADLKEGKAHELQAWLSANEKEFANAHPEGARYVGSYFTIYGDRNAGGVQFLIELDSYGAQDALAAEGQDPNSVYAKLLNEIMTFIDQSSDNGTNALYKSVTAATLWGQN